ncbi:MAG: YbaB/EbfC family nucleoid-associated protein, partial [Thermoanaerobaculia bacterium]
EEMQEAFRLMSQKEPGEPVYLYNSIYCNLKNDTMVHKEEHRQQVQAMIDGLYGKLDSSLVNALNLEWQFKTLDVLDTMENMQEKMQERMKNMVVEGSAGGGMVKIWLTGEKQLQKIEINPEILKGEEKETLEELIMAAFNDASEKINREIESIMQSLGGGFNF